MNTQTERMPEPPKPEALKPTFDFLDLKAQFTSIREDVLAAVARVFESQHFILGPEVKSLEEELAAKFGVKHVVGCASGTDALILSLMATNVGPGDEVITTPFSFIATAGSIAHVGAKPVFVDIDPVTYNMNPALIKAAITERTRAIMPVHLFGLPADMAAILKIAREHGLVAIEDAAQAIGARYNGENVGTLGNFGCFSFFPSKNLGGAGDGGCITTNDDQAAERLRMLRVHGSKKKYQHEMLGTNSRLDALQAAVLRVKLPHLDDWTEGRRNHAEQYRKRFEELDLASFVTPPVTAESSFYHVYNQFTIRSRFRDELQAFLRQKGVPTEIYYPLCLHLQPAFRFLGYKTGDCPVAEELSEMALSLPVCAELTHAHQELVVRTIAEFYVQKSGS